MKTNGKLIGKRNVPSAPQSNIGIWYNYDQFNSAVENFWPNLLPNTEQTWKTSKIGFGTEKSLTITTETSPQGFCFGNNGTRLYVVGAVSNTVRQFNLSTAWDISTATFSKSFALALNMASIFFSTDGTLMFILGTVTDLVYSYSLSTAWEVDSASAITTFSVTGGEGTPWGLAFSPDGLNMYIVGTTADTVRQYVLGTAWNIATISGGTFTYSRTTSLTFPREVRFSSDGTKMFVIDSDTDNTRVFTLTTPWRIDTANAGTNYLHQFEPSTENITLGYGFDFSSDGRYFYILDGNVDRLFQFEVKTPFDVFDTFAVEDQTTSTGAATTGGLFIRQDGVKLYISDAIGNAINEYNLPTPWSISSKTLAGTVSRSTGVTGLFFNPNGSQMFTINSNGVLNDYSLARAWDITSASVDPTRTKTISGGFGLFFDQRGTYLYTCPSGSTVNRFTMSTPWDITTTGVAQTLTATNQTATTDTWLSPDGTILYIIGELVGNITRYSLPTPWSLSGAVPIDKIQIESVESVARGLTMSPDGIYMYYSGNNTDFVRRITIAEYT